MILTSSAVHEIKPTRYSSAVTSAHWFDADRVIVGVRASSTLTVIHRAEALALAQCVGPRTLVRHAAALRRLPASAARRDVFLLLRSLVDRGLLRPDDREWAPASAERIATIAIPTADRPALLQRCVESYRRHAASHGHGVRFVVCDGSTHVTNAKANRGILRTLGRETRTEIVYLGPDEAAALRHDAQRRGFSPETIGWLFTAARDRYSAGAVRNLILVATAGQRVLSVDDDTIASVWTTAPRSLGRHVTFVGHADPRETSFFQTRASAAAVPAQHTVDLLSEHGDVLGRRLVDLAATPALFDATGACEHILGALRDFDGRSRVRAVWSGLAGDAGVMCQYGFLLSTGSTRQRLAASALQFRLALEQRDVRRCVRQLTVTDTPTLMLYCGSLDNTSALPPFNPQSFNEDGQFGSVLRAVDRDSYIAQTPASVIHDSSRPSRYAEHSMPSATRTRMADVVQSLAETFGATCESLDSAKRTHALGTMLVELATADAEHFRRRIVQLVVDRRRRLIGICDQLLASGFSYPAHWRSALISYREAAIDSLSLATAALPTEYRHLDASAGWLAMQGDVRRFGQALIEWPHIWNSYFSRPLDLACDARRQSSRL